MTWHDSTIYTRYKRSSVQSFAPFTVNFAVGEIHLPRQCSNEFGVALLAS